MKKTILEKHPYEIYCKNCNTLVGFVKSQQKIGSIITSTDVILVDGTFPKPGEIIKHAKECLGLHLLCVPKKDGAKYNMIGVE